MRTTTKTLRILATAGLIGLGGVALGGVGCGSDPGTTTGASATDQLRDGLTILSSDPAVGVSTVFKQNGRVIYLETKVGPLKEQPMRDAFPNDPDREMDARVVDQEGHTFQLVIGGDHLIDSTWAEDLAAGGHITTPAEGLQRDADFALAREAGRAFASQATPDLKDHVYHLSNMTAKIPSEEPRFAAHPVTEQPVDLSRDYGTNGCSSNAQQVQLYTIALLQGDGFLGGIVGDVVEAISGAQHSTTSGWNYNFCTGGTWDENIVACNHGTCANSGTMSYSCSSYSGYASNTGYWSASSSDLKSYWLSEANNTTTIGAGCATHYGIDVADITIYGGSDSNHVCNDDSARELDEVRYVRSDANNWSGGSGGWNGNFTCEHSTHWYGPLDTDAEAPNCP
jgi:hypothetical protein